MRQAAQGKSCEQQAAAEGKGHSYNSSPTSDHEDGDLEESGISQIGAIKPTEGNWKAAGTRQSRFIRDAASKEGN